MFSPWDYVPNFPYPIETPRPVIETSQPDKTTGPAVTETGPPAAPVTERRDTPEIYIPYI